MQQLIDIRIAQVKSLHDMCETAGLNPPFTISEFDEAIGRAREDGLSETEVNRIVLFYHRLVHELLYTPPRRG